MWLFFNIEQCISGDEIWAEDEVWCPGYFVQKLPCRRPSWHPDWIPQPHCPSTGPCSGLYSFQMAFLKFSVFVGKVMCSWTTAFKIDLFCNQPPWYAFKEYVWRYSVSLTPGLVQWWEKMPCSLPQAVKDLRTLRASDSSSRPLPLGYSPWKTSGGGLYRHHCKGHLAV